MPQEYIKVGDVQKPAGGTHKSIQISAKDQTLTVDTGNSSGDVIVIGIIGAVIILTIGVYGYFFGTRLDKIEGDILDIKDIKDEQN